MLHRGLLNINTFPVIVYEWLCNKLLSPSFELRLSMKSATHILSECQCFVTTNSRVKCITQTSLSLFCELRPHLNAQRIYYTENYT